MYEDAFFERIAKLRDEKGVSARDMSLSIGQSAGYINNIENRKNFPSMTVFFYICEYFNISPKEFFDDETENPYLLQETVTNMKRLTTAQLTLISQLVKEII